MIIDFQTQVWHSPNETGAEQDAWRRREDADTWVPLDGSPSAHEMAASCVDVSFVMGFRSRFLGAHIASESVAAFVAQSPNRRVGFMGIDPMDDGALGAIDAGLDLGLSGLVISPMGQNFHPTHSRAMRIYERCEQIGVPIVVRSMRRPTAGVNLAYGRPILYDEVARAFPNLRMVLGGLGYPWVDEMFVLAGKHRHVYTDVAGIVSRPWQLYNALVSAFEYRVLDRILFASDFPHDTPQRAISRIYSLNRYSHGTDLPSIPRQQLQGIVERDVFDCLGLNRPSGAPVTAGRAHVDPRGAAMHVDDDLDGEEVAAFTDALQTHKTQDD